LKCVEGYVVQRNSAPYGAEVFRVKVRETGDFRVWKGRLQMGMPCPFVYDCVNPVDQYEGLIVEIFLDNFSFFRLRPDKLEPNSSVIIARCMSEYKLNIKDFLEVCRDIVACDNSDREVLNLTCQYVYEDSEYGKCVRRNKNGDHSSFGVYEDLVEEVLNDIEESNLSVEGEISDVIAPLDVCSDKRLDEINREFKEFDANEDKNLFVNIDLPLKGPKFKKIDIKTTSPRRLNNKKKKKLKNEKIPPSKEKKKDKDKGPVYKKKK